MKRLRDTIARVATLSGPVLIRGESGTGKDVVARALHRLSGRSGRYVAINAGALSDGLADSELFGHAKGAFTGAVATSPGAFEMAHRGTLFLDEVADLSAAVQVKLLRATENGEVRAVGSAHARRVDARLVTASWSSLEELASGGGFRADLYHRISTLIIDVPPLRERKSDIEALARLQLARKAHELGARDLSHGALAALREYHFPGNVRELFSVVYRAAAFSEHQLQAADIQAALPAVRRGGINAKLCPLALLADHEGNVSAAARAARMPRSTFRSWLGRARRPQPKPAGVP